jgi:hypothetical protein
VAERHPGCGSPARPPAAEGIPVRYLGATYVPADESLSCRFDGTEQAVRTAHLLAGAPLDRVLVIHEMTAQHAD